MAQPTQHELRRIFDLVISAPHQDRSAVLDRECRGDSLLRKRLEVMVAGAEDERFLGSPTIGELSEETVGPPMGTHASEPPTLAGQRIGRYKLLQQIGEGGFGSVWLAEQFEPVKRRVAIKIIKLGMDTRQVIARFEAERQALAMMDHPNIARVLDAGATETGRPYFVMEYIKGVPVLEYCDGAKLDTRARLELFSGVCNAIQHAHQKGIIHRDIKPSNVLVTMHDGVAVPKVIDFGIAKATGTELTQRTLFTERQQVVGTPTYMSPEQAETNGIDIDTRSDIYSLGVLLYELLTGTTPFATNELLGKGFAEMVRIIREVEPAKPSTRLSTLGITAAATAQRRAAADTNSLRLLLRGDLDWIVMKCLEKDRTRRYETANGLAADVQRHLNDEPVTAAAPSNTYRFQKFIRRHRARVAVAAAILLTLVLGIIGTTGGLIRALHEQARADAQAARALEAAAAESTAKEEARKNEQVAIAEALAAKKAGELELKARTRAETVAAFVTTALQAGDAQTPGGKQDMTILDAMSRALADIDSGRFENDAETEAQLRQTIGTIIENNGRTADALPIYKRAVDLMRSAGDSRLLAVALNAYGNALLKVGKPAEAFPVLTEAVEMTTRVSGPESRDLAPAMDNVAKAQLALGHEAEALALYERLLEMRRRIYKTDDPDLARGMNNLAHVLERRGRAPEAEKLFREALDMQRRLYEGDHPSIATSLNNIGFTLQAQGKLSEAEPFMKEGFEMLRRMYRGDHPIVARGMGTLGNLYLDLGRVEQGLDLIEQSTLMSERLHPEEHPFVVEAVLLSADSLLRVRHFSQAEVALEKAINLLKRVRKADDPDTASYLSKLARAQQALGKTAEGRRHFDESLAMLRRLTPDGSPMYARILWRSGTARLENQDAAGALPELEQAVRMAETVEPQNEASLGEYRGTLAKCQAALKK